MYQDAYIVGGDTETIKGEPYSLQFAHEKETVLIYVSKRDVLQKFCSYLYDKLPSGSLLYYHNLEFDLPVIFYPFLSAFKDSDFTLEGGGFRAEILFGKVNKASLRLGNRTYEMLDTFAYFKTSLYKLADVFKLPGKLPKPKGLGTKRYTGTAKRKFEVYAIRDAEVTLGVGKEIQAFHRAYDVNNTISAPQLSARIFRHSFIPDGLNITANDYDLDEAACLSFHGGKNGLYVPAGIHRNVKVYDINSAYPYAMTKLPNFLDAEYQYIKSVRKPDLPGEGIVRISGSSAASPYNLLRSHDFQPIFGEFAPTWITTYELKTALRHGFLASFKLHDAYIVRERKHKDNPLKEFANEFFKKKQEEKGPLREFYKIVLNSLYGKFVQNIASNSNDSDFESRAEGIILPTSTDYQAGGLWNPLLGTMITGFVRAYLTELEVKYKSLHSSTDSIMTVKRARCGNRLGDLSIKAEGTALFLRPKLYLIWNSRRELTAYALHGYHGRLSSFLSMLRAGKRTYAFQHMTKVRESFRQNKKPLMMETLFRRVNIPIEGGLEIPKLRIKGGKPNAWI